MKDIDTAFWHEHNPSLTLKVEINYSNTDKPKSGAALGGEDKRGELSDDKKSRMIRGVIDDGFPMLMREEAGVEDGRKGEKRNWVMTQGGGR